MIRVHRAANARELRLAPEAAPFFEASTVAQLMATLDKSGLSKGECEAVRRAASQLDETRDANILIAANGSIFRVERMHRPPVARAVRSASTGWATSERGIGVVVAHPDAAWSARAVHALRFVGYAGRRTEKTPVETIMTAPPLVILVAANEVNDDLIEAASDRCALVALVEKGTPPPRGVHGVLTLPLHAGLVAGVIDPLIRKARSGRLRLGKATPRP